MTLRFDLHTHTFFSKDACNSPEEMIEAAIRREHPYELPEVVAVCIAAGSPQYLEWLHASLI